MSFKLIVFDCDGTLVESELVNNTIISKVLEEMGFYKYSVEYCLDNFTGNCLPDIIAKVNKDLEPGQFLSEDEMMVYIRAMENKMLKDIKAADNADFTLQNLQRDKCVVSNGERHAVIGNLKNTGLIRHFLEQDIFTREQVANPKPAPDLFLRAALMKEADVAQSLVIEDSPVGVIGAKQAGMTAFGFVGCSRDKLKAARDLKDAGADLIIHDLKQIIDVLLPS